MKKILGKRLLSCLLTAVLLLATAPLQAEAAGGSDGQYVDDKETWDCDYNTDGGANWVLMGYWGSDQNVEIPKNVAVNDESLPVRILNGTFRGDANLVSVDAASSGVQLKKIMDRTFQDCSSLELLRLPHSLQRIEGSNVFSGVDLSGLTIEYVGSLEEYRSISGAVLPPVIRCLKTAENGAWHENDDGEIIIEKQTSWTALTINYVYEDGSRAAEPYTELMYKDQSYSVNSPVIEGFTPMLDMVSGTSGVTVSGKKENSFESKTVTYYRNSYWVMASVFPPDGGKVSGEGKYTYGSSVTLTAEPNEGYEFLCWEDEGSTVSTNAAYTFTVNGSHDLKAWFEKKSPPVHTHTSETVITRATLTKDGSILKKCSECGEVLSETVIAHPDTFKLSADTYTYDGTAKKPAVTVKDVSGKSIAAENYTVSYTNNTNAGTAKVKITFKGNYSGTAEKTFKINAKAITPKVTLSYNTTEYNGKVKKPSVTVKDGSTTLASSSYSVTYATGRKNVGAYKVTVKMKDNYSGSASKSFKINPKGTAIENLTPASKAITVKWKKQDEKMALSRISGYQIQIATDKDFSKNKKSFTAEKYSSVSKKITNLTGGKKYYVHIRTYKTVKGVKYWSKWSGYKTVTTKK